MAELTETAVVSSFTQFHTYKSSGITRKQWLTANDEKVRDSHVTCGDEGPVPYDESFENGLMYPSDPSGSADEVINCRCALQPMGPA